MFRIRLYFRPLRFFTIMLQLCVLCYVSAALAQTANGYTNPDTTASATLLLTWLGLGKNAAGIISLVLLVRGLLPDLMPLLPVASATSPAWYAVLFGILARITGNYGKNAPVPANGMVSPSVMVPTPAPATLQAVAEQHT
jgi:hypothetical protein